MILADTLEPLTYDAAYWIQGVWDPEYPLEDLGDVCVELGQKLRAIGIISLLTAANIDNFQHNLIRGAACWEVFLSRCRAESHTDHHDFCAGRIEPLLSAIAGHDDARAARLAELGPGEHRAGHEHEADYAYARALQAFVSKAVAESSVPALLALCAEKGDEMCATRAAVGEALLAREQAAFDESFASLIRARQAQIEGDKQRGKLEDACVAAEREIFVEGLALLAIAEQRRLVVQPDYAMCPSLARERMRKPFPGR
jgi:hypothetical protein